MSKKIKISYLGSVMFRLVFISLETSEHFLLSLWCADRPVLFLTVIPHCWQMIWLVWLFVGLCVERRLVQFFFCSTRLSLSIRIYFRTNDWFCNYTLIEAITLTITLGNLAWVICVSSPRFESTQKRLTFFLLEKLASLIRFDHSKVESC